jgi:myo-inositol-1(or 4)-monophosphatase
MDLAQITKTAIDIAREAGDLLREGFGRAGAIGSKSSSIDLVTEYDLATEALITGRLQSAFPTHSLIGEEGGQLATGTDSLTWYIDPLDGTNNFAHGLPVFVVSLGLYTGNEGLVGVIYDPLRDDCFYATQGEGAYRVTGQQPPVRLRVSQAQTLEQSLLATGFPYDRHTSDQDNMVQLAAFLKRAQGLRRMGSAALDLAYVAAGRLDGYWEYKLYRWDVAAGLLLVQEAGGVISDTQGALVNMTADRLSVVAANAQMHDRILAVIRQVAKEKQE